MLLVWGTNIKRKKLGWVAEFCPTCREPTPFKLSSLRSASHIYFLTSRNNGTVGHEIRCSKCKTRQPANALRYSGVSHVAGVNIAVLADETNPTLSSAISAGVNQQEMYQSREQVESHVETDVAAALLEGYAAVQARRQSGHLDGKTFLACVAVAATLVAMATGTIIGSPILAAAGFASFGIALVATFILAASAPARFAKRKVVPGVQGALACLNATAEDVAVVVDRLKRLDVDVRKMFSRKVFREIETSLDSTADQLSSTIARREAA